METTEQMAFLDKKLPTTATTPDNALVKVVETSGLEKTDAAVVLGKFQDYFRIAADWENKVKALVVTSPTQIAEMKMAREGRLFLRAKRLDIEHTRKELKEQYLRKGKAVDGFANILKALFEPMEEYLDRQERFVEIKEEEMRMERLQHRLTEIQTVSLDPAFYDLKNMPEENYRQLIDGERKAIQARIEETARIEAERIAKEKAEAEERERLRAENERQRKELEIKEHLLKKEREEAEKKLKAEQEAARKEKEAADARQKAIEQTARKEKAEADARERKLKAEQEVRLKKEREERERLEAQLKAKAEAEAKEKKRAEDEKKAALKAPDKIKLMALASNIDSLEIPEVKSAEAKKVVENTRGLLAKISEFVRERAVNL